MTFLVVKDKYEDEAKTVFSDTNISVTTCGKRHLGAAVGVVKGILELLLGQGTLPPNMSVTKLKSGARS